MHKCIYTNGSPNNQQPSNALMPMMLMAAPSTYEVNLGLRYRLYLRVAFLYLIDGIGGDGAIIGIARLAIGPVDAEGDVAHIGTQPDLCL